MVDFIFRLFVGATPAVAPEIKEFEMEEKQ
jgi:hypothetical protein